MVSKLETELVKATGCKPKAKEDRSKYLERLVLAVQDLNDDDWEKLSKDSQDWVNEGAKAYKAGNTIQDFDDDDSGKAAADADEKPARGRRSSKAKEEEEDEKPARGRRSKKEEDEEEDEKPARRTRSSAKEEDEEEDEKPARRSSKAKEDEKPARGRRAKKDEEDEKPARRSSKPKSDEAPKGEGVKVRIKKLLIDDPNMSVSDIEEELAKSGDKPSRMTVAGIRADFRHSLRVLKSEKLLTKDLDV